MLILAISPIASFSISVSFSGIDNSSPAMERIETNPQFAQIMAANEMIAIVTLNIKVGDSEGFMNVCLPFATLENIMDKLNTKYWFSTMQEISDESYQEHIEAHSPIPPLL